MTIDWVTIAAQIANFLVLVWLLKRFLFGPVVAAMDRREARIAQRLHEAAESRAKAEREAGHLSEARAHIEAQREALLAQARDAADGERRRLVAEARREVSRLRAEWVCQAHDERDAFLAEVRRRTAAHVYALARRVLADLADADLDAAAAHAFLRQLDGLDEAAVERLAAAAAKGGGRVSVLSARALPAALRRRLGDAVRRRLGDVAVGFAERPELIVGFELRARGQVIAWSLEGYLEALEARLGDALASLTPPAAEATAC